jgi:hypothetical protein
MAADSITPKMFDIETLNQLAVALDDHADSIEQVTLHKLEQDIRTAARVASEMAHWRFDLAELAASLPAGNFARNEILKLLGKDMLESAEDTDKLTDLRIGFRQVVENHGLAAVPRWLAMELGLLEIVKTEPLENDPDGYSDKVTATFPAWLLAAEAAQQ